MAGMIPWLQPDEPCPAVDKALAEPNGLLAAGDSLAPERLVEAYRRGIFPWFNEGEPVLWWSPDPRMVLMPAEIRVTRSLAKTLRNRNYSVRADSAFREVMQACAEPRDANGGTWISDAMIAAYGALHDRGIAHSVEIWIDGTLAGGLYGVAIGRMFYGESMFTRAPDASKIALVHLARQLQRWNFGLIDCQMRTDHLARMGGREIPRADFVRKVCELVNYPPITGAWTLDDDLA